MAGRKSMANMLLDNSGIYSPPISSPLRRKSVLPQMSTDSALSVNNDEEERLARRRESIASSTPVTSRDRRQSLGLNFLVNMPANQMAERITQCIKLSAENKINLKNAFSLEMIDFMIYMIKRKDDNMSNLQVASTSLDVSTKIYGFRVDGIHMEILKMLSGLDKQDKESRNRNNDEEQMTVEQQEDGSNQTKKAEKKKKKKRQDIFTTVEALKVNVETDKPSLITLDTDSQSTDTLYQTTLPNHANSKFYQHPYNDILVDIVECEDVQSQNAVCNIPQVEDFSEMHIAPTVVYFDFQSWSAEDEPEVNELEEDNESQFQFDLDASLPHDEPERTSMCYFDIEDNDNENIERCVRVPDQVENIVDFRKVLTTSAPRRVSEYSFVEKNLNIHWAGPSHWKASNFKKASTGSRIIGTCHQGPGRKRKEVELIYDDEIINGIDSKFSQSQLVKLHVRTAKIEWCEEALTLPPDEHYCINSAYKLYLHSTTLKQSDNAGDINATHLSDIGEPYNYENENDTSNYCPDIDNEDHQNAEENNVANNGIRSEDEGMLGTQIETQAFTGDNLVAIPKLTNISTIAYCVRAKKIDMRQLKKSIWKCLTTDEENNMRIPDKQNVNTKMTDSKLFSEVYKKLPIELTKTNAEVLSFPISFVSLLHLANEKTLKVTSELDMSDLIVQQD